MKLHSPVRQNIKVLLVSEYNHMKNKFCCDSYVFKIFPTPDHYGLTKQLCTYVISTMALIKTARQVCKDKGDIISDSFKVFASILGTWIDRSSNLGKA